MASSMRLGRQGFAREHRAKRYMITAHSSLGGLCLRKLVSGVRWGGGHLRRCVYGVKTSSWTRRVLKLARRMPQLSEMKSINALNLEPGVLELA